MRAPTKRPGKNPARTPEAVMVDDWDEGVELGAPDVFAGTRVLLDVVVDVDVMDGADDEVDDADDLDAIEDDEAAGLFMTHWPFWQAKP